MRPLQEWLDNVAEGALTSKESLRATYDIARLVIERGVPGDFVECGVYGGSQCAAMARAIMDPEHYWDANKSIAETLNEPWPPRRVHLFDTFSGIPQAGEHDLEFLAVGHEPGLSACSVEGVKQHMEAWGIPDELLVYHPGLFADTVFLTEFTDNPVELPEKIALLRLDGDLYESTAVCLRHLYPLLSPGGWLIVDDFGLSGARKAVMEYAGCHKPYMPAYFQKQP